MRSSTIMRLTIKRTGIFEMRGHVGDDSSQCGNRGTRQCAYRVVIEGDPHQLTPQGFIIDNNDIQRYFDVTYGGDLPVLPSCENIAIAALRYFRSVVPGCKAVDVTIDGTGAAGLTASWRADGQDVPILGIE